MKLARSQQVHYDSGPNMTPMVDIVMVILVFFMLGASFVGVEHFLRTNLPAIGKGGEGPRDIGVVPDEPLEIIVDSPLSGDRWVARAGAISVADRNSLANQLRQLRTAMNSRGITDDRIQVVINPGKNVKYKYLVEVYQAALQAEFTKIAFSTAH